mgnify:CR=1 FL=1
MNALLLSIIGPMFAAVLCLFFRHSLKAQRLIAGIATHAVAAASWWVFLLTLNSGPQVLRLGHWPDAYGIVLAVDLFGALLIATASLTQIATYWFIVSGGAKIDHERTLLHPFLLLLTCGVNWAFSTGDLFNLFVSFEILLISSYVLLVHGGTAPQLREGFKFVVLNLLASTLFLIAAGFSYGLFGSLNMAELAVRLAQFNYPKSALLLGTLFLLVFCAKAATFPLYFWLPDAYPKAPPGILAYFGGVLTKVGVYCLYRVFTLVFRDPEMWANWFQPLLMGIAITTMFVGVMGAYGQVTMRRILCFHIVSQIGYMILGLALFTPVAIACGIFYIVHNMIVKSALLMVADAVLINEGTDKLKKLDGLMVTAPLMAFLFLLAALSLAGIPPFSGFYGKFGFVLEALRSSNFLAAFFALLTGLFTLASMVKICLLYTSPSPRD